MNKVLSELMVTLELLTTSQIVVFNIPSELELVYSEPLTSLLGLTHPTKYYRGPRKYEKYHMNLNRGIDAIYVYSDVIQTKLVRDSIVPLLSVVPLRDVFWEIIVFFSSVHSSGKTCVFHNRNVHNGQRGKTLPFSSGKVTVLLHFKQKDD